MRRAIYTAVIKVRLRFALKSSWLSFVAMPNEYISQLSWLGWWQSRVDRTADRADRDKSDPIYRWKNALLMSASSWVVIGWSYRLETLHLRWKLAPPVGWLRFPTRRQLCSQQHRHPHKHQQQPGGGIAQR